MALKRGELANGYKFKVDDANLDDMELIEDLAAADAGNILKYPAILERMLGEKEKDRLYDFLRDKNGRVKASVVSDAIQEIFVKIAADEEEGKN